MGVRIAAEPRSRKLAPLLSNSSTSLLEGVVFGLAIGAVPVLTLCNFFEVIYKTPSFAMAMDRLNGQTGRLN